MSWFNSLAKTYDKVEPLLGINPHKPEPDGVVLVPFNHWTKKADVTVTINEHGEFVRAESVDKKGSEIIIPCTEKSRNRTSGIAPHPLHDALGYLSIDDKLTDDKKIKVNLEKREKYLEQLGKWSDTHKKVSAVHKYVLKNTLIDDLHKSDIKVDKDPFVRFRVESNSDYTPELWKDKDIVKAWQKFCDTSKDNSVQMCDVSGTSDYIAGAHAKNVNSSSGNAYLVSCNDNINFTYRGRFSKPEQANSIGVTVSHKAHAMLKYLIAAHGSKCGTQAIVAWAVDDAKPQANMFSDTMGIFNKTAKSEADNIIKAETEVMDVDYTKKLRVALLGMGDIEKLKNRNRMAAVLAVDAATTGRMAITFFQAMPENEYINRVVKWHEECNWWFRAEKGITYVSAPSVERITEAIYGKQKGDSYQKIQKQVRERMLSHILCGEPISRGWILSAVANTSRPESYEKMWEWENVLSTTCALLKKFYLQKKEVFNLKLDYNVDDRSYLFGRLLAIADSIEYRARKEADEKRPTNAIRYMTAFASKPMRTWKLIFEQINPYVQKLDGALWLQTQIDEIMDKLFEAGGYDDKPLDGRYLMGYSLQRRELMNKNKKQEEIKDESN